MHRQEVSCKPFLCLRFECRDRLVVCERVHLGMREEGFLEVEAGGINALQPSAIGHAENSAFRHVAQHALEGWRQCGRM